MTERRSTTSAPVSVRVAIDVAKQAHQVLIEAPNGQRRSLRVANTRAGVEALMVALHTWDCPCEIAFEPTGDYHRPLAYWLGAAGFQLHMVSSIAVARTREARYNSWDKNDPKDAQVILHLLKTRCIQRFVDPGVGPALDLQEVANTYHQLSLRKVRLHHALVTHHLPLFLPRGRTVPAQLTRDMGHRPIAIHAVSGGPCVGIRVRTLSKQHELALICP